MRVFEQISWKAHDLLMLGYWHHVYVKNRFQNKDKMSTVTGGDILVNTFDNIQISQYD